MEGSDRDGLGRESVDYEVGEDGAADDGVYVGYEALPAEGKLLLEGGRGDVDMEHPLVDITARGVAVYDVARDFGPQVGCALLVDSGSEAFMVEVFLDDFID